MHVRFATAVAMASAALVALAAACSTFEDSTPPAADASTPDGPTPDTATSDGATIDAYVADADAGFVCPTGAFCDDFERDTDPELNWTYPEVTDGGTLAIVPDDRTPGGRALGVTLLESANDDRQAYLHRSFGGQRDETRLSFSFRVLEKGNGDILIAQLQMSEQPELVFLMYRDGNLLVSEQRDNPDGGPDLEQELVYPAQVGTGWRHITLTYERKPAPKLKLVLDGQQPAEITLMHALGKIDGVEIGSTYARAGTAASFLFDDVVIEQSF